MRPRLSIILAAHPPGGEIKSRLDDLRKLLSGKKDVEVLLADYGVKTPCFFGALPNKLPPGWRYFFFRELDFPFARIAAARRARGTQLIFLDPSRIPSSVWREKIKREVGNPAPKKQMQKDASAGIATKRSAPESQGRLVSPWLPIQKGDLFRLPDPEFLKPAVNQDLAWPSSSSFRAGTSGNSRIQAALPSSPGSAASVGGLLRSRLLEGAKRLVRYGGFATVLDFSSLRDRHEIKRVRGIRRIQKIPTSRCHYPATRSDLRPPHPRLAEEETFLSPPGFRLEMAGAKVFGPTTAVCDADNRLIVEASADWGKKPEQLGISRRIFLPRCRFLPGKTFLAACPGAETYFHWMTDTLPMLLWEKERAGRLACYDHVFMHPRIKRFHLESLQALGLDPKKVQLLEKGRGFQCEKVIFHTPHHVSGRPPLPILNKVAGLFFRLKSRPGNSSLRLAIFRKGIQSRSLLHSEELEKVLSRRGFIFYDPEQHSIHEQARMFHGARVILAAHGSALTNLIFCRRGTRVIELFSSRYVNPCYRHIAQQLGLKHLPVLDSLNDADPVTHLSDSGARIAISGKQLARVLDSFLGPAQG